MDNDELNAIQGITTVGGRARVAMCLALNRGKWMTIDEIAEQTNLSPVTIKNVVVTLTSRFPSMFEKKGNNYRFKGLLQW